MQSHFRLGVFFFENPRKQPDAKVLNSACAACTNHDILLHFQKLLLEVTVTWKLFGLIKSVLCK